MNDRRLRPGVRAARSMAAVAAALAVMGIGAAWAAEPTPGIPQELISGEVIDVDEGVVRVRIGGSRLPRPGARVEFGFKVPETGFVSSEGTWVVAEVLDNEVLVERDVPDLVDKADRIGLDVDAFRECLATDRHSARVQEDVSAAMRMQLSGTPSLLVDGRALEDKPTFESLVEILERELAGRRVP